MSLFATSVTPAPTAADQLTAAAQDLAAARAELETLEQRIKELEVVRGPVDVSDLDATQAHYQEVLADLALGRASQPDLAQAERTAAAADIEARRRQRPAQQAAAMVQALRPRLEAQQTRVQALEIALQAARERWLLDQGDQAVDAYRAVAEGLVVAWERMRGIEQLLNRNAFTRHRNNLRVPMVMHADERESIRDPLPDLINDPYASHRKDTVAALRTELAALESTG